MVARRIRVGTPASGAWTEVYNWSSAGGGAADDNGWNGYTIVQTIPLTDFSATTGSTRIRLTLTGGSTEGFILSAMYVGNGGGGDVYDFGGTPVQMLMSGGGTITVGAGATVVTDDVAFVKDAINPFVMAMQFQDSAHDNLRRTATGQDESTHIKNAIDAATQNKSGYSANFQTVSYIAKIELFI